jgi:hypothetical protein
VVTREREMQLDRIYGHLRFSVSATLAAAAKLRSYQHTESANRWIDREIDKWHFDTDEDYVSDNRQATPFVLSIYEVWSGGKFDSRVRTTPQPGPAVERVRRGPEESRRRRRQRQRRFVAGSVRSGRPQTRPPIKLDAAD